MRTTVDLPDELMRAAKARAATRGESLKELLTRAVATEIGRPRHGRLVSFPMIGSDGPPVSQADIEATDSLAEDEGDLHRAFG